MAMAQHRVMAWVWRGVAGGDLRTGFVEMSASEFAAAAAQGRAQDPRVGGLHLNHISNDPFVIPLAGEPEQTPAQAPHQPLDLAPPPIHRRGRRPASRSGA